MRKQVKWEKLILTEEKGKLLELDKIYYLGNTNKFHKIYCPKYRIKCSRKLFRRKKQ